MMAYLLLNPYLLLKILYKKHSFIFCIIYFKVLELVFLHLKIHLDHMFHKYHALQLDLEISCDNKNLESKNLPLNPT